MSLSESSKNQSDPEMGECEWVKSVLILVGCHRRRVHSHSGGALHCSSFFRQIFIKSSKKCPAGRILPPPTPQAVDWVNSAETRPSKKEWVWVKKLRLRWVWVSRQNFPPGQKWVSFRNSDSSECEWVLKKTAPPKIREFELQNSKLTLTWVYKTHVSLPNAAIGSGSDPVHCIMYNKFN